MESRSFALALSAVLLGFTGCAESPGRLIVLIESDISILTHVEVSTSRLAGGGVETRGFPIGSGAGDNRFPFSFAVEPNGHPEDGVEIRVEGYDRDPTGATPLVSRTVRTGFVAGTTRLVRIALKKSCRGVVCVAGATTCESGICETIPFLRPADLLVLTRLGAEFDDAGVDDATVADMSADGGWDLDVPDLDAALADDANTDAGMSTCVPDSPCAAPVGGVCDISGVCACPAGQSDCSGTCNVTGAPCGSGDAACGGGAGTVICSGTTTTCSVTARTSGLCGAACSPPTRGICTCNATGTCVHAYVDICQGTSFEGTCLRIPEGDLDGLLAIDNLRDYDRNLSSVRLVNVANVVLYRELRYGGTSSVTLTATCADLANPACGSIGNAARSMQVNP
jgi:hypothetical protein